MLTRGPSLKLRNRVLDRIHAQPGKVWTSADFFDLGPLDAVHKALQRLVRTHDLSRVARGLYYRSTRINTLTGKPSTPDHNAIIKAVAQRHQTRFVTDGLTAANGLGLTTAVPARVTVLTGARLRPIRLGNQQIRFKAASPSRLYWADRPAMPVVQALYWVQDLVGSDRPIIVQRLRKVLNNPDHGPALRDDLKHGLHTLPIWMQSVVHDLLDARPHRQAVSGERLAFTTRIHH